MSAGRSPGVLASRRPGQLRALSVTVLEEMRLSCDLRGAETELQLREKRPGGAGGN